MSLSARLFVSFLSTIRIGSSSATPAQEHQGKVDCIDQQGIWIDARYGDAQTGDCVTPTADSGQGCQSKNDCQSACVTDDKIKSGQTATGKCFGWPNLISHCVNLVDEKGQAEDTVCYD